MQKTPRGSVVAYLPERFADWEAGLACAELNKPDAGYRVLTMSADGTPRRSIGGWTVAADLSPDELPDNARLLMLVGGETWLDGSNDAALRVVDACEHTGNAAFEFAELAPAYRGQKLFRSTPAVDGGAFITANGAASVEFARLVLARLGVRPWGDERAWFAAFKRGTFVEG